MANYLNVQRQPPNILNFEIMITLKEYIYCVCIAFIVVYLISISTNEECKPYPTSIQQETEELLSRSSQVVCLNYFYISYQGACSPVLTHGDDRLYGVDLMSRCII